MSDIRLRAKMRGKFVSDEAAAVDAFKAHRAVIEAAKQVEDGFMALAKELYFVKNNYYYANLGFTTFNAYLHDNDISFPASLGHALVKMYEQLAWRKDITKEAMAEIGQTKAVIIARTVEAKVRASERVDEKKIEAYFLLARTNSVPTFRQIMREEATGVTAQQCAHDDVLLRRCKSCYRFEYVTKRSDIKDLLKKLQP